MSLSLYGTSFNTAAATITGIVRSLFAFAVPSCWGVFEAGWKQAACNYDDGGYAGNDFLHGTAFLQLIMRRK